MAQTIATASPARAGGEKIALVLLLAALAAAPFGIYPFFLMQALCFALFACAFNLLIGYVGLLSFGHAMFLGTGGYIAAHFAKEGTIYFPGFSAFGTTYISPALLNLGPQRPEVAILIGVAVAALVGLAVGQLAIKRQGIYFSMITLALSQMIYFIALQAPFTHGEDGIQSVPRGMMFGVLDLSKPLVMYFVVLAIFMFGVLLIYRTINSPFGEVLKAIRENEPRAVSLGYKVDQYKLAAFVLSASLVGLAGATKAIVAQSASLTDVHWTMSGEVVLMTLVGGLGTLFGPIAGAFVIVGMQTYLSGLGQWVTVIQGVIFVACVLAFRRGIIGEIAAKLRITL